MMIILQDLAFLVPEESDIKVAAEELAKHLDEPLTKGVETTSGFNREHYLISDEPLEFRRHHSVTNVPRCLGRMLWNT